MIKCLMQKKALDIRMQATISTVGITVQYFAQWLISVLLVRMDGYEVAGIFSLSMSISNVFAYFANYGLRNYQITDAKKEFLDMHYLMARAELVFAAGTGCVLYLLWAEGYSEKEKWAILIYLIYNLFTGIGDTLLGAVQVRNHLEISGFSCAVKGAVCFASFLGTFLGTHNIAFALVAMAVGALGVVAFYDWPMYRRYVPLETPCTAVDFQKSWRLWPACFTLMLSQVVPIITTAIPRRTIQSILGVEQLGVFSSVFTPTVIITTLAPAVVTAILPKVASYWETGNVKNVRKMLLWGLGAFVGSLLIAVAAISLCGKIIMSILFDAEILAYFTLLYWAVLTTISSAVTSFLNGILTAIRHTTVIAPLTIGTMVITAMLSQRFIGLYGIYGAAYLQILVYSIQLIAQVYLIFIFLRNQ